MVWKNRRRWACGEWWRQEEIYTRTHMREECLASCLSLSVSITVGYFHIQTLGAAPLNLHMGLC